LPAQADAWLPEVEIKPAYPVPYGRTTEAEIAAVLQRIHGYLDGVTPTRIVDRRNGREITDFALPNEHADAAVGVFRSICYEAGVTYGAMLAASDATGDPRYRDYAMRHLQFIADRTPYFRAVAERLSPEAQSKLVFRAMLAPRNLDDAGSLGATLLKARRAGLLAGAEVDPLIEHLLDYIRHRQFRLDDGTLARNRPLPRSLWLDDLYMCVPALAQMTAHTGDRTYIDDAVRQVTQFATRMFNQTKGVYCHGWVEGMEEHPEFHWARANGWALLAKTELLDVLPSEHPGHVAVLELFRHHVRGLATLQSGQGRWHQLLDRNDSYLETSASAIFVYCIARGINRGWIDPLAYGPMVKLGWHAVAAQVNVLGQVEGTCVGSGMAMDPMFYYYRPTSPFAAHGYGPTLLAAAEMIRLTARGRATIHDSALHFGETLEEA
jgi:rhamnogalacturonyl hydrolase YesR